MCRVAGSGTLVLVEPEPAPIRPVESYAAILARPVVILVALVAVWVIQTRPRPVRDPIAVPAAPVLAPVPPPVAVAEPAPSPAPRPKRTPRPIPEPIELDREAVARAEASLDEAARERARADGRLAAAEKALQAATIQAAQDRASSKTLASRVRDPSARIASASSQGGFLRGERDRLKNELAALERIPITKARPLLAKNAVAKPTDGAEYHFEVRRDHVSFIDLDRLVEMVKTDAKLRLRTGGMRGRLGATVGPVGSFSLRYEMGRSIPDALADVLDVRDASYNLLGWEIIPGAQNRGEPFETTRASSSSYARALARLTPGHDTITMWIYPDGFALYRKLRDDLHTRGFLVAARPLPEGTSIKGSPVGSLSAGQ